MGGSLAAWCWTLDGDWCQCRGLPLPWTSTVALTNFAWSFFFSPSFSSPSSPCGHILNCEPCWKDERLFCQFCGPSSSVALPSLPLFTMMLTYSTLQLLLSNIICPNCLLIFTLFIKILFHSAVWPLKSGTFVLTINHSGNQFT